MGLRCCTEEAETSGGIGTRNGPPQTPASKKSLADHNVSTRNLSRPRVQYNNMKYSKSATSAMIARLALLRRF